MRKTPAATNVTSTTALTINRAARDRIECRPKEYHNQPIYLHALFVMLVGERGHALSR
jgi:hypothetical protein